MHSRQETKQVFNTADIYIYIYIYSGGSEFKCGAEDRISRSVNTSTSKCT